MTATPEALTLMLYNGALRFMSEGKEALEKKDYESANNSIIKAEKIITEFRVTLDFDYEISHQLLPLYNYVYDCLVQGNLASDTAKIDEAAGIIRELRDAWAQAMKKARAEKSGESLESAAARARDLDDASDRGRVMEMRTPEELWQLYLELSHEMLKFIKEDDIDRFLDLEEQRAKVFEKMEACSIEAFKVTQEGRALVEELKPIEMQIIYNTKVWLNKSRTQHETVRDYEVRGFDPGGHLVNREM